MIEICNKFNKSNSGLFLLKTSKNRIKRKLRVNREKRKVLNKCELKKDYQGKSIIWKKY